MIESVSSSHVRTKYRLSVSTWESSLGYFKYFVEGDNIEIFMCRPLKAQFSFKKYNEITNL